MAVDLHVHSTFSDGSDDPDRLFALAAGAELSSMALTDHDTLEGLPAAAKAARRHGVRLIPGAELSCPWPGGTLHLVVLFLHPGRGPLQDRLAGLQAARSGRNAIIVRRLQELGIDITLDEVLEEGGGGSVGRPHVAAVMVRNGVVPDLASAFDQYLANGRPAYVERERLSHVEAIGLARASGAVPVLAHPFTLGIPFGGELRSTLRRLADAGLIGVEVHYSSHTPEERVLLQATARAVGLVPGGGSDYHGSYKPEIALGSGRGDLIVPDEVLEELEAAIPAQLSAG